MIAKKYRLTERQVKKVLRKGKPFFSYNIVMNVLPSRETDARFAVVVSGKSAPNAVTRNAFRRLLYETCRTSSKHYHCDIVFVLKKDTKLLHSGSDLPALKKEIIYLLGKKL